ncbi:MAG: NPCBM/NEW2 domain-containing protein [Tepidisphaeraceae bacterium]
MTPFSLKRSIVALAALAACASFGLAADRTVPLASLDLKAVVQDFAGPRINATVDGNAIKLDGKTFETGVGAHANSRFRIAVNGAKRFSAIVGIDDDVGDRGAVRFRVYGDNKVLFDSGPITGRDPAKPLDVSLVGVKELFLVVTAIKGIDYAHADWADAKFVVDGDTPATLDIAKETAEILTPPPAKTPRINGAAVFGVRPGSPILYTIAATGDRPMKFTATGLPDGATFDENTGRLGGRVTSPGTYAIKLSASNSLGKSERNFKLVVGDKLALTPLMGWNSWYGFADRVTDERMRFAADQIVKLGLIDHGYSYVCIDDFWQQTPDQMKADPTLGGPGRDAAGNIVPNPRFPDMKALADYIHSRGLKAGLYSSPGPKTCGGALGSYQHESLDAKSYVAWGFDLLKYDWCSYRPAMETQRDIKMNPATQPKFNLPKREVLEELQAPYVRMGKHLKEQNRDIFYLMCQYGMGESWNWGRDVGGQSARSTHDITDTWASVSEIGFGQVDRRGTSGPGFWADPDMLMLGVIGLERPRPTRLTPNEQYTQMTLWSILPAPLLFGAHLDKIDDFTMSLLTNDEVIAVNQDALGKSARRVSRDDSTEVWARDLEDGSVAVAMFNRDEVPMTVTAKWADVGISGRQTVRDLWRQKDAGTFDGSYSVIIPRHGAAFLRLTKP